MGRAAICLSIAFVMASNGWADPCPLQADWTAWNHEVELSEKAIVAMDFSGDAKRELAKNKIILANFQRSSGAIAVKLIHETEIKIAELESRVEEHLLEAEDYRAQKKVWSIQRKCNTSKAGQQELGQAFSDLWTIREKLQTQRLTRLKASLAFAKSQFQRLKNLSESGAISGRTFLEAENDLKSAQEMYDLGQELKQLAADASKEASERLRTL
jgi:multidrug resistance efflux pump